MGVGQSLGHRVQTGTRLNKEQEWEFFPTYEQLKTLALSLWGEFPRHWNDFTIPDNDGSARRRKKFELGSPRPPRGEFQKDQAFSIMAFRIPNPDPQLSSTHGYFGPFLMSVIPPDPLRSLICNIRHLILFCTPIPECDPL